VRNKKRMKKGKGKGKRRKKKIGVDFSYIFAVMRRELRNINECQCRCNFDKIPQLRTGCSNLDQRITNNDDEVAEVAEILSYDQMREVAASLTIIAFSLIPVSTHG
jgi:hypothetical protein